MRKLRETWSILMIVCIVLTGTLHFSNPVTARPAGDLPAELAQEGLSSADWALMQAQIAAAQYHFTQQKSANGWAYRAPNPANGLNVAVGESGISLKNNFTFSLFTWDGVSSGTVKLSAEKAAAVRQSIGVTETVTNTEEGIAYQALIQQPAAANAGSLAYQLSGEMTASLSGDGLAVHNAEGNLVLRIDELLAVDAAGKNLPAVFSLDGDLLVVTIDGLNESAYPLAVTLQAHNQSKKLIASDGEAGDGFGFSVAISGDVIVVGGRYYESSDTTGAAYVFQRQQGGSDNWGQVKKITASDAATGDRFGTSVAVDGDVIVVGAFFDNSTKGAAYVFQRQQGGNDNWDQVKKLVASNTSFDDFFGSSLAVSGDVIVVGAYKGNGYDDPGAAYVFQRQQGGNDNWGEVKMLTASNAASVDQFGISVGVWGDVIVVGAWLEDSGGSDAGAAFVYQRQQGGDDNWGEVKKLIASDAQADDNFGRSVAVWGDVIVVGAMDENSSVGAAYVFQRMQGGVDNWGEVQKLTASDAQAGSQFGRFVAVWGDMIIVGADAESSAAANAGAVYAFYRSKGGSDNWGQVQKLTAADAQADDWFGTAVAICGDTIVVGAYGEDTINTNAGAAYVFQADAEDWLEVKKSLASDAEAEDLFGGAVAVSGDVIVVGAKSEDTGGTGAGAVYVFLRMQGGNDNWGEVLKLTALDAQAGDNFGISVAVWGNVIVVGAWNEESGGTDAGAAYVFQRMEGGSDNWDEVQKLTASDAQEGDNFGASVAVWGDVIVVGASREDSGGTYAGAAYVFQRMQDTPTPTADAWGEVQKLTASNAGSNDYFGASVAVWGDVIVVGASFEDGGSTDAGAAYVFQRMQDTLTPTVDAWGEVKKLTASDPGSQDSFGGSVAVWGDVIVVGAEWDDRGVSDLGAAYVFQRMQGGIDNWGQVKKLVASGAQSGDRFGVSVATSGDVIVVGAWWEDSSGSNAGAAYVFQRMLGGNDNWGEVQKLTASDPGSMDLFGHAVAISGDVIVVGADFDNIIGENDGSAYIFQTDTREADLSISKTDSPDPVRPGQTLTYTLSISNAGPDPAENVQVSDVLTGGVTYQSASGDGWSCSESGGTVTCTRASLAVGSAPDIIITVTAPSSEGTISNSAQVTSDLSDTSTENNTDSEQTTVAYEADLSLEKSVSVDTVYPGETITYTLSVSNTGPDGAAGITVTDTLPAGVTYQNASGENWSCSESGGTVTCTRATLAVGSAPDITITVNAPGTVGDITNNASVSSTTADPNTGDNSDSALATVNPSADLTLSKTASPDLVNVNSMLTYTLSVENLGGDLAEDVLVTDTLPAGVTYQSASGDGWSCSESSGTVTCTRLPLAVGTAPDITITVMTLAVGGDINNSAAVSASTYDPVAGNNSDAVIVSVQNYKIYLPMVLK